MTKTALITGASSGIGLELAKIHASKGDNLVLVARSIAKLEKLKLELEGKHKISVLTIEKDLSMTDAAKEVFEITSKQNIQIDYLINNAGFGDYGVFTESKWEKEEKMINLNIICLTQFCKLYLKEMQKCGSGKIMNVASTASFQPGPNMSVYFATKAFVLHFSEAINKEVKSKGVSVTALCPGATESGFVSAAAMGESSLVKGKKLPTSKEVAKFGYKAMMKGKAVAIHGFKNYLLANLNRFAPRSVVVNIVSMMQRKAK